MQIRKSTNLLIGVATGLACLLISNQLWAQPGSTDTSTPKLTQQQIIDQSLLPYKGNLTTGFFECMTQHQGADPEQQCLPAEITFQTNALATVYNDYVHNLSPSDQKQLAIIQAAYKKYGNLRCNWYLTVMSDSEGKVKRLECILEMTMNRRLELENLTPQGD